MLRLALRHASPSLPAPGARLFQSDWYLDTYADVREAGIDPLVHFLETGARERRRPNPLFLADWYAERYLGPDEALDPFRHYLQVGQHQGLRFNPIDDPAFIREEYGLGPGDDPLLFLLTNTDVDRVSAWFSRKAYLAFNPDIAAAGAIPEVHYLAWGLREQRLCGSGYFVTSQPITESRSEAPKLNAGEGFVEEFRWAGSRHRVSASLVSEDVLAQIRDQALIDPDVAAAGIHALASIRQVRADDPDGQFLSDYRTLLEAVPPGLDAVVILTALRLGGAEKYGANLAWGLAQLGPRSVLVVTTEDTETSNTEGLELEGFTSVRDLRLASLGDLLRRAKDPETIMTQLLLRATPKHVFVVNSWIGLQAIKLHGRALSGQMRLATTFFCEAPYAQGTPLSALYLRDILPYATVISDNRSTLVQFAERVGPTAADRFHALPTTVSLTDARLFERTLKARRRRHGRAVRALWLSRWERTQKAVDVLMRLAELKPDLSIHAYGPNESRVPESEIPPNITLMGRVSGPSSIPLLDYDVFLFTSYFEGMPNVVLEMAGCGIPIIASDVGGLRETFSSEAIEFVPMSGTVDDMAMAFQVALARVTGESDTARMARLIAARAQVEQHHGTDAFLTGLQRYVGWST